MDIIQIILIALIYAWFERGWPSNITLQSKNLPFMFAPLVGLVLGDWKTALIVAGTIQTLNMSPLTPGSVVTVNMWFATCAVAPMVILQGMSLETGLAVAAPLALLGAYLNTIEQSSLMLLIDRWVDKAANENNTRKMLFGTQILPSLIEVPFRFAVMFLALIASNQVVSVINVLPTWIMAAFNMMGKLLPAVGFGTFLSMIGKTKWIGYFIVGFYAVYILKLSTIQVAFIGVALASLHINYAKDEDLGINLTKGGK